MTPKLILSLALAGLLAGCGIDGEPLTPPAAATAGLQMATV